MRQAWPLFLCALALCPSPAQAAPAACANGDPVMGPAEIKAVQGLRVDSGWVRWPGPKATTYQGHLHLFKAKEDLNTLVILRQVSSPLFEKVVVHAEFRGEIDIVAPVYQLVIQPGFRCLDFSPTSESKAFLSLEGPKKALAPGDAIPLRFHFLEAGTLSFSLPLQGQGPQAAPGHHD